MAARKKAASKKNVPASRAPAKRMSSKLAIPSDLSSDWRERLSSYAKRDAATASGATGWPYIGTRGGIFRFNDDNLEELPPMIILGVRYENTWFSGDFDPDKPASPDCFAISKEEDGIAPPEMLGDARQCMQSEPSSEVCAGCWANAFGTADRGRGKACKNIRRIAMIPADNLDAKYLAAVPGAMLRIPVTSVKNYSTFANKVTKGIGVPLFAMRTNVGIEPDDGSQFRITFEPCDMLDTDQGLVPMLINDVDILSVLETRVKEADTYLDQLPNQAGEAEAPQQKKRLAAGGRAKTNGSRKATRKKAPRKKGARKSTSRRAGGSKY